jgi:cytochrome c oxidase assembly factor CtaG
VSPYGAALPAEAFLFAPALGLAYLAILRVHHAPRWRQALFALGLALLLVAFVSPLQHLAVRYLLIAHLLQNVVLAEWTPALVVAALPPAAAAALTRTRAARAATHPLLALPLWLANYFTWHLPWIYDAALRRPHWLLHLEHLSYLVTGILVWWPVLQDAPRRLSAGVRAAYVFTAFALASPLGLLLALLPRPIYEVYRHAPLRVWGLTARSDQEIAGATMALEEAAVFFAVFLALALRFLRFDAATGVATPRRYPG